MYSRSGEADEDSGNCWLFGISDAADDDDDNSEDDDDNDADENSSLVCSANCDGASADLVLDKSAVFVIDASDGAAETIEEAGIPLS